MVYFRTKMDTENKASQRFEKTKHVNLWRNQPSGVYYLFGRFAGKLKKKSLKTTVFTIAKLRLADETKALRQAAARQNPDFKAGATFDQLANQLIQRLCVSGKKPRTIEYYQERLAALYKFWPGLANSPCARITTNQCVQWAERYQKDVEPSTYNGTLKFLKQVLKSALEDGLITANPVTPLQLLKSIPKKPTIPTQKQFEELLNYLDKSPYYKVKSSAKLIRLLASTGMRIGEAKRLLWKHVDFEKRILTIHGDPDTGTKNWRVRHLPLFKELSAFLQKERELTNAQDGEQRVVPITSANGTLATGCKELGIEKLTNHDLRDVFCTRCIESGVDIPTVAGWVGHRDGGALLMKTYAHLRMEHSFAMAEKVDFGI